MFILNKTFIYTIEDREEEEDGRKSVASNIINPVAFPINYLLHEEIYIRMDGAIIESILIGVTQMR